MTCLPLCGKHEQNGSIGEDRKKRNTGENTEELVEKAEYSNWNYCINTSEGRSGNRSSSTHPWNKLVKQTKPEKFLTPVFNDALSLLNPDLKTSQPLLSLLK